MRIAVEGCMHGDLDNVYKTLDYMEKINNYKIDLLLCCGDFQAVRNEKDMESLNVPRKYREMKSFWKYYSGQEVAPIPTVFIGGNHEASNYLWELYYGGWTAPNIYFLGFAGVVKFGNVRIGGLSGIYNARHYHLGHYERPPYNEDTIRSVYHVREYDVHKLMQVEEPIDIFLSHDWPRRITDYGNWKELVRYKKHFEKEIQDGTLGSEAASQLLEKLKPSYWFSAHLHCKFAAHVQHGEGGSFTKFLALDKCLPGRKFLQVFEIESGPGPYEIQYDEEWLAITQRYNSVFPLTSKSANLRDIQLSMPDCRQWVRNRLQERGAKPFEFARTVPCYNPSQSFSHSFSACFYPGTFAVHETNVGGSIIINSYLHSDCSLSFYPFLVSFQKLREIHRQNPFCGFWIFHIFLTINQNPGSQPRLLFREIMIVKKFPLMMWMNWKSLQKLMIKGLRMIGVLLRTSK